MPLNLTREREEGRRDSERKGEEERMGGKGCRVSRLLTLGACTRVIVVSLSVCLSVCLSPI